MKKLFVYGDSISMQYGFALKKLVEERNCEYDRKGGSNSSELANPVWNGLSSCEMLEWIKKQGIWEENTLLLFNVGLHDVVHIKSGMGCKVGAADYEANLRLICKMASNIFSRLIFVNTTPVDDRRHNVSADWQRYNDDVVQYNDLAENVMRGCNIPVIDLYTFTRQLSLKEDIYMDGVHMKNQVSEWQAKYIIDMMSGLGVFDGSD